MKIKDLILLIFSFFIALQLTAQSNTLPETLFKIERNKDKNVVYYDLRTKAKGKLDKDPINIYWIRDTEGGIKKPLTWIQKHYAYGIRYKYASENIAKFYFVSYKKMIFTVKKNRKGKFSVFTTIDDQEMIVSRIFIQIDGGTFWLPLVSHVELYAFDPKTKTKKVLIIKP